LNVISAYQSAMPSTAAALCHSFSSHPWLPGSTSPQLSVGEVYDFASPRSPDAASLTACPSSWTYTHRFRSSRYTRLVQSW
jgi:hypothetical protein